MKKIDYRALVAVIFMLFLSGCCRIADWTRDIFYQGVLLDNDIQRARNYIRTLKIYDEFTTRAIFDVIWLSDTVRAAYAHSHSIHFGQDSRQKESFLQRQLQENESTITFYVLSLSENPLDSDDAEWTVFMTVGDMNYFPTRMKAVDLPHEYKLFWGSHHSMRFKTAYEVNFDAKDGGGSPVLGAATRSLILQFRSADKKGSVEWRIDDHGNLICQGSNPSLCYLSMRKRCAHG